MDSFHLIDTLWQDLRYGGRQLRLSPGFTLVAVLSLALGVGANTAIFQLVDAVRLRTLPVQHPEELVSVDPPRNSFRAGWSSTRSARFTYAQWEQIRSQQQAFSGIMAWSATRFNLAQGGEARNAEGLLVSGDFFRVLGVNPILGRTFTADDDRPGCGDPGVVLSHAFWQREYGSDPNIVGKNISLTGHALPVIGVTTPQFFGVEVGRRYDVAIPLCADPMFTDGPDGIKGRLTMRTAWWLSIMGRLKPGWTAQRAAAQLEAVAPGIMQATLPAEYRAENAKRYLANKLTATAGDTGVSGLRRQYETPLWLLLAITGLVLLIACANLANLLLARASVREREFAVRLSMGASRWRLIRQLLAESLLLAMMGAALGAVVAQVLSRGLVAFLTTPNSPLFVGLGLDLRILGFTAALTVLTCLLFGLLPALRATRMAPAQVMRAGGRGLTAGKARFTLRRALVVTQVALSIVLLTGALLFVRSLQNLLGVDSGFQPEHLLAVNLDLRNPHYAKDRLPAVFRELDEKLKAQPGITSAAEVALVPISGSGWNENVRTDNATAGGKNSNFNRVGVGYFRTMGTTLLAGRDFNDGDTLNAPKVAVVNEAFAEQFFDKTNPIGKTFRVEGQAGKPDKVYQVVGFVKNTKYYDLREDFYPVAFFPMTQDDDPGAGMSYVVRSGIPTGETMASVKAAVAAVNPSIGIEFRPMPEQIKQSLQRERLMATLSGAFGLLAGLLATLGLYGVISYMVAQRRNEIGVRIALGANRGRVVRLVLREAGVLLVAGIGVGVILAIWAAQAARAMLFGLQPHDPATILAAVAVLTFVALAASYGPARRAAGLEPMAALREE